MTFAEPKGLTKAFLENFERELQIPNSIVWTADMMGAIHRDSMVTRTLFQYILLTER